MNSAPPPSVINLNFPLPIVDNNPLYLSGNPYPVKVGDWVIVKNIHRSLPITLTYSTGSLVAPYIRGRVTSILNGLDRIVSVQIFFRSRWTQIVYDLFNERPIGTISQYDTFPAPSNPPPIVPPRIPLPFKIDLNDPGSYLRSDEMLESSSDEENNT